MSNIVFVDSFFRSGSNFLNEYFYQATGDYLDKTHDIRHIDNLFTIIRNPLDSIASTIAMAEYHKPGIGIEPSLEAIKKRYSKFYKHILDNINNIILYEDLINSPQSVVAAICKKQNIEYREIDYVDNLYDGCYPEYLKTALVNERYPEIYDIVSKSDLKEQDELYYLAYSKHIIP